MLVNLIFVNRSERLHSIAERVSLAFPRRTASTSYAIGKKGSFLCALFVLLIGLFPARVTAEALDQGLDSVLESGSFSYCEIFAVLDLGRIGATCDVDAELYINRSKRSLSLTFASSPTDLALTFEGSIQGFSGLSSSLEAALSLVRRCESGENCLINEEGRDLVRSLSQLTQDSFIAEASLESAGIKPVSRTMYFLRAEGIFWALVPRLEKADRYVSFVIFELG